MANTPTTHSRFTGLDWYGIFEQVVIVGAGSIGSWASHFIAKMGHRIFVFDDDRVEEVNLAGQNFSMDDINKYKVNAVVENLALHSIETAHGITSRFVRSTYIEPDNMVVATDNITSRKVAFEVWMSKLREYKDVGVKFTPKLYIDGRLNPEHFQIFCVPFYPDDDTYEEKTLIAEKLYLNTLFEEDEVADLPCSAKYTTHTSAMIGSMIASLLANFITNVKEQADVREVPFLTEMTLPLMLLETKEL